MQAIIMAAGKGSRLGKLTQELPKSFLEIRGIKLIDYNIAMLHAFGIRDIVIVTGYKCEKFKELVGRREGIQCVYNPFYEMVNVLGSFYMAQNYLMDDFVYLHADTLCAPEIFERMLKEEADIVLPIDFKRCDEEAMKVKVHDGEVNEINKTMSCEQAAGEFIGIAQIKKNVISDLKKATTDLLREKQFMSYFEGAVQRIIDSKYYHVKAIATENQFWSEIDFLEDYKRAKEEISDALIELVKGDLE